MSDNQRDHAAFLFTNLSIANTVLVRNEHLIFNTVFLELIAAVSNIQESK